MRDGVPPEQQVRCAALCCAAMCMRVPACPPAHSITCLTDHATDGPALQYSRPPEPDEMGVRYFKSADPDAPEATTRWVGMRRAKGVAGDVGVVLKGEDCWPVLAAGSCIYCWAALEGGPCV